MLSRRWRNWRHNGLYVLSLRIGTFWAGGGGYMYFLHFHTTRNSLWRNFECKPEILRIWIWERAPWAKAAYFVLSSVLELVSEQCFVFFCSWLYKLHSSNISCKKKLCAWSGWHCAMLALCTFGELKASWSSALFTSGPSALVDFSLEVDAQCRVEGSCLMRQEQITTHCPPPGLKVMIF